MRLGTDCVSRRLRVWAGVLGVLAVWFGGIPVQAAEAESLARYFPRQDLAIYAEFDGLDAHDALWRKTAAYRLLTQTSTGAMLESIAVQLVERSLPKSTPQLPNVGELKQLVEHALRHGFAIGVGWTAGRPQPNWAGLVLRDAATGKTREALDKAIAATRSSDEKPRQLDKPKGRKLWIEGGANSRLAWWKEGDDLAVSLLAPESADVMIESLDGGRPNATGHPERIALARAGDSFTPVGFAFADMEKCSLLFSQSAGLGLEKIKRLEYRWGIQGEALMTATRLVVPAPRTGLLALVDQPTFGPEQFGSLPPGLAGALAFSVDLGGLYDRFMAGLRASNVPARNAFQAFELGVRNVTGLRIRDDFLAQLGTKVTYFTLPSRGDAPTGLFDGLAQGAIRTPRFVALFELKDAAAFAKLLSEAATKAEAFFRDWSEKNGKRVPVRIHPLKGVDQSYTVSISPTLAPFPAGFRPTLIVVGKTLIFASNPDDARATLDSQKRSTALPAADPLAAQIKRVPRRAIVASVVDDRRSLLPELVANLPLFTQWSQMFVVQQRVTRGFGQGPQADSGFGPFAAGFVIDPDVIPTPEQVRPFLFPSEVSLAVDDQGIQLLTSEAFPLLNPAAMAPVALAMLVPAAQAGRISSQRTRSTNNLKGIGLAMHNYHSVNGYFPAQATYDKKKKPLLSWRVALLPYLEQAELYNEFKLDEPWDSPHNKALIPRMPAIFAVPGAKAEPGKTYYRGFAGEATLFDPRMKENQGIGIAAVTDGTSATIGIIEAKDAVVWTKPEEEIPFVNDPNPDAVKKLLATVGNHFPGGFNALFIDGSVRFIKTTLDLVMLRALITRNGGEVIRQF